MTVSVKLALCSSGHIFWGPSNSEASGVVEEFPSSGMNKLGNAKCVDGTVTCEHQVDPGLSSSSPPESQISLFGVPRKDVPVRNLLVPVVTLFRQRVFVV